MYQRILNITIVSNQSELFQQLENIQPLEQFTHSINQCETLSRESAISSDIIILESSSSSGEIIEAHRNKQPLGILIVCLEKDQLSLLTEIYDLIDYLLITPIDHSRLKNIFNKAVTIIKDREDARLTNNYLDTLINSLPDLIWFKDKRGAHLKVNDSFCETVNKTHDQIEGRGHYYIWDIEPDDYSQGEYICLESEEIVLDQKKLCLFDETVKCGDQLRKFKTYKAPIFDSDNKVIGTVGCAHDVTDLKNLMIELNILIECLPFAIMVTDREKVITSTNQKFINLFQLQEQTIIGKQITSFLDKSGTFTRSKRWLLEHSEEGILLLSKDKILKIHDEELLDTFGTLVGHIYLFLDITLEYHDKNKLLLDANTDYLTKLNNRRRLQDFMRKTPCGPSTALLLADLDNFKEVNDEFGHDEGDKILVAFSNLLQITFPIENLFRLGGDEFAIVIPAAQSTEEVTRYAEKLLKGFNNYIIKKFPHTNISISIGIALNVHNKNDFGQLFKQADIALYDSKKCGKSTFRFWSYPEENVH